MTGRIAHPAPAGPQLPERYADVRPIGAGGMASIWSAADALLGRRVAIKVLAEHYTEQPRFVERFMREARTAAMLSGHPHVVTIYDVGEEQGRPFIVMEYLGGGTLADRMARGRPDRDEVLSWLRQAASALDFAHEKGVVHRDVKPRNLLFDDRGRLVVADFGIARAAFEESLTATNELLGTAAYISPEQARGESATAASDRYAFAVVAFEALTGGLPFGGGTLVEIAARREALEQPRASERAPDLPAAVDDVLMRGLAVEPDDRWPTATTFIEWLDDALGEPAAARPERIAATVPPTAATVPRTDSPEPTAAPVGWSRRRRRAPAAPLLLGLAAIVTGLIVGLTVLGGGDGGEQRDRGDSQAARSEREAQRSPRPAQRERDQQSAPTPAEPRSGGASPAQLNDQGFALMNAGRYDEAIPVLQRAVNSFPAGSTDLTLAYALYNLGRSLRLAGRPDEAIPILERRLQFNNQRGVVKKELEAAQRDAGVGGGGGGEGNRGRGKGGGEEGEGD